MIRNHFFLALAAMLAACSGGSGAPKGERQAPLVSVAAVADAPFIERVNAVGTARANEQVTLASPVTDRILRLNFDDGDYIRAGQVVAVLAAGQQQAQLQEAEARAREAQSQLRRLQELRDRGFATASALDAQVAAANQANAQAAQVRAAIGDRVIRAPFSGWVSLRTISAGAVVNAGTEIATISDISRIKLDFAVPERLLPQVRAGQPIIATSSAYPDAPFRGTISSIDPVLNPETRAATVRAVLDNPDRRLKPGMLLTVAIESQARSSPAVPELAVVVEGEQSFVYEVREGRAARVPVQVGLRQNGLVEILDGLRPGQRIIFEGVVKVAEGQRVRVDGAPRGNGGGNRGGNAGEAAAARRGGSG